MNRQIKRSAAPLLTLAVVLTLHQRGAAQPNAPQPDILDQTIEMKLFQQPDLTLKGVLDVIQQKLENEGKKLPIFIDIHAFKVADPDFTGNIYETKVRFPDFPPELSISTALRLALSKVATKNATLVVIPDHVLITTVEQLGPKAKINQQVRGVFQNRDLGRVLHELSELAGVKIVLDNRLGDKADIAVSAAFHDDVPLTEALRVFTEMAGLTTIFQDDTFFVTDPANAEALRKKTE